MVIFDGLAEFGGRSIQDTKAREGPRTARLRSGETEENSGQVSIAFGFTRD
jgi:hypothetical protein